MNALAYDDAAVKVLLELCQVPGVSGHEEEVAATVKRLLGTTVDRTWTDALGNLYALRQGRTPRRLMIDAHLDEIGLMVQAIDSHGFLLFETIGGWDPRVLPAQAVEVVTSGGRRVPGIVGSQPPHIQRPEEKSRPFDVAALFIDVGASSPEEVASWGIRVGDTAVLVGMGQPFRLGSHRLAARALDNRVGCAVAINALRQLADEQPEMTVVATFTVAEEVGLRGAAVAARTVDPEIALVLEGTVAADVPGLSTARQPSVQGAGPAITLADKHQIVPRRMIAFLETLAREEGLPIQRKRPASGGTNGGAIHTSGRGVLTGVLACPCRYIHSPIAQLHLADYGAMIALTTAFIRRAGELLPTDEGCC